MNWFRRNPGLCGWAGVVAVVTYADAVASHNRRPTMSQLVDHAHRHPVAGPLAVGAGCGLFHHLFISPLLRSVSH